MTGANLDEADLHNAEFHDSTLTDSSWHGAQAVGTILRGCRIDDVDFDRAHTYRVQFLNCRPSPAERPAYGMSPVRGTLGRSTTPVCALCNRW